MKLTAEEKLTIDGYQKFGKEWSNHHAARTDWEVKREFSIFQKYLPSGKILEIGCGFGRDAEKFIQHNYNYYGIDVSKTMIKLSQEANPNGRFFCCNMAELEKLNEKDFDGFWAVASLLHISKQSISGVLKQIHQKLKPNGIGFISIKKGDREFLETELSYENDFPRFYALYTIEEFTVILENNGFKILEHFEKLSGKNTWLCIYVQKI